MSWLPDLRYLIENDLFIICDLLPARQFISLCRKLGINTSEEQLEQFEKLGIFYPFARVQYPDNIEGFIDIWSQKIHAIRWLEDSFIWEPSTKQFQKWNTFEGEGLSAKIISFYSIFQCYPLYKLKQSSAIKLSAEFIIEYDKNELDKLLKRITSLSQENIAACQRKIIETDDSIQKLMFDDLKDKSMWRGIAANICQIISNRYYPETQSDGRSIRIAADVLNYPKWSWYEYCRNWDAHSVLKEIGLNIDELRELHKIVVLDARWIDPLESWYELVRFISLEEKQKLKGIALFAQEIYSMEKMLRLFYEELTSDKLPFQEVPPFKDLNRFYGINTTENVLDHLKFVANKYKLNPKPNLILIVEGNGEEEQFPRLAEELLGYSFPILGIEIRNLKGVGNFTGKKALDKYGALEKFIDDYHSRQTIVFIILDNEGRAGDIKNVLIRKQSSNNPRRTVTKEEYVHLWERSIEFDNFSCEEIAKGLTELCNHEYEFTSQEIDECKVDYDSKRGDPLEKIFGRKVRKNPFSKTGLLKLLIDVIILNRENEIADNDEARRKIVRILIRIIELAKLNNQPITEEIQRLNQESGYFGDIIT